MSIKKKILCLVAGRSGGHLIPALTLAKELHTIQLAETLVITTNTPLDHSIMHHASYITHHKALSLGNVSRNPFIFFFFIIQCIVACIQSYRLLRKYRPERIISIGGVVSIPVCLMGRLLSIPIDLYELNAVPGKAISFLSRFANHIFVCFEQAKKYFPAERCSVVAYPIRFLPSAKKFSAEAARQQWGISAGKKVIFISGGSQGSIFINTLIKQWLELNPHIHTLIHIIHQTGARDITNWQQFYRHYEIPATIFEYQDNLAPLYQACDLIVCRAGAGSLFEALFFEKPCLVVPLEAKTTDHQKDNAYAMAQHYPSLFTIITEADIKKDNMAFFSAINKRIYLAHPMIAPKGVSPSL